MLIEESRDTLRKYAIALIIANVIAIIGMIGAICFFGMQVWMLGMIAYIVSCTMITINICCFVKFYRKLNN